MQDCFRLMSNLRRPFLVWRLRLADGAGLDRPGDDEGHPGEKRDHHDRDPTELPPAGCIAGRRHPAGAGADQEPSRPGPVLDNQGQHDLVAERDDLSRISARCPVYGPQSGRGKEIRTFPGSPACADAGNRTISPGFLKIQGLQHVEQVHPVREVFNPLQRPAELLLREDRC